MRTLDNILGRDIGRGPAQHNTTLPGPLLSGGGFVAGPHGQQFWMPSPRKVVMLDDFLGDVIADQWNAIEGTDSATSDCAILSGGIGGVLRLTTGDAGTGLAADQEELVTALQWQASNGGLEMEVRAKLSAITTCWAFIGFTDLAASLEGPITSASSADTFTTNASDAVGFMFDTRMNTDVWWLTGVAADVDAAMQQMAYAGGAGIAPVADTYATFRIEVSAAGAATFYYNGRQVGTVMTGALTPATDLTPVISVSKTSVTASMTMDVDYVYVAMDRAPAGGAV